MNTSQIKSSNPSNPLPIKMTEEEQSTVQLSHPPGQPSASETPAETIRLIVIGKSGTGKSTLCNRIIEYAYGTSKKQGSESSCSDPGRFDVGQGLVSLTTKIAEKNVKILNSTITVVDTPQTDDTKFMENQRKLTKAKGKGNCKVAIIVCVRCDERYAAEEHSVYNSWKRQWGKVDDFCSRVIVAFTHGDKLLDEEDDEKERPKGAEENNDGTLTPAEAQLEQNLKDAWPQLQDLMKDAGHRFVLFNNKIDDTAAVERLSKLLHKVKAASKGTICSVI